MTIIAVGFLLFIYFFDWVIYGRAKFTLVHETTKTKSKSRPLPINEHMTCGTQDINDRTKVRLDDANFIVDIMSVSAETQNNIRRTLCLGLCVEPVTIGNTSSTKSIHSIKLGEKSILLERPKPQPFSPPNYRLDINFVNFCQSCKTLTQAKLHRVRQPSLTMILRSFERYLLIILCALLIICLSLMFPQVVNKQQLPILSNSSTISGVITASDSSLPINNNESFDTPELHVDDYILVLHQDEKHNRIMHLN